MHYANSITELIGKTPLLKLNALNTHKAAVFAKLEMFNPMSSVKDRAALNMILAAEQRGEIAPHSTIVEPTSGNTGIALACICAVKGYKLIITMPDTLSVERRKILAALGAKVVLTEGAKGMKGAIEKARELAAETNAFMPMQFENPDNTAAHLKTTAVEIYEALDGKIDFFVAGVGTGGTITGVGAYLKEKNKNVKIIAAEPKKSPVLSGGQAGPHAIEGIGAGFVPKILDLKLIDEIIRVADEDAFENVRNLAKREGVFAGPSSGAALFAAFEIASRPENAGKNIVVILPDTGERYLSKDVFAGQ